MSAMILQQTGALLLPAIALALLITLAACGGGDSKEAVIQETLDCIAENDPFFEQSMMMMFPAARDLEDAKRQYIYISTAAPLEDLKAARDEACGNRG